jgi:hypothetical protein
MYHEVMADPVKQGYLFYCCPETFHQKGGDMHSLAVDAAGLKRPVPAGAGRIYAGRCYPDGTRDGLRRLFDDAVFGVFHSHDAQLLVI